MTNAQHELLPSMLREIIDLDRRIAACRAQMPSSQAAWRAMHGLRGTRARMRDAARARYGSVPLRGDSGPSRPTAAAAR